MIQFLRYPSSYPDDKKATGSSDTFVDGFKLYAGIDIIITKNTGQIS